MSIKVSAINTMGSVGKEWLQSIKRRPLEKGVGRYVTVVTNELSETLGRSADGIVTLSRKTPNGAAELTIAQAGKGKIYQLFKFQDGSFCETSFKNGYPSQSKIQFMILNNVGKKCPVRTVLEGPARNPLELKKIFLEGLHEFLHEEPDLKAIDDFVAVADGKKSKLIYKIQQFFKQHFKRKLAVEIKPTPRRQVIQDIIDNNKGV